MIEIEGLGRSIPGDLKENQVAKGRKGDSCADGGPPVATGYAPALLGVCDGKSARAKPPVRSPNARLPNLEPQVHAPSGSGAVSYGVGSPVQDRIGAREAGRPGRLLDAGDQVGAPGPSFVRVEGHDKPCSKASKAPPVGRSVVPPSRGLARPIQPFQRPPTVPQGKPGADRGSHRRGEPAGGGRGGASPLSGRAGARPRLTGLDKTEITAQSVASTTGASL